MRMTRFQEARSSDCSTGPITTAPQETSVMSTRRGFLGGTLSAGALLALQGCTAMAPQTSKRVIVDAQIHLWGPNSPSLPWVPNVPPQMPEPFTIERALPLMDEAGVDRAVVVPPSWVGDRNDYALEAARRYPGRFAVMGRLPLNKPEAAAQLANVEGAARHAGSACAFRGGIGTLVDRRHSRLVLAGRGKGGFARDGTGRKRCGRILPGRRASSATAADHRQHGNHGGGRECRPGSRDHRPGRAAVQVSQCLGEAVGRRPTSRRSHIHLPTSTTTSNGCSTPIGPQRCYWGTDITNGFAKATYRQRVTHFTETLRFLSESDKDWIMGRALMVRLKWA